MLCAICDSPSRPVFKARILSKYDASYFSCPTCGFLQTEEPYWLEEAYRYTLNAEDTCVLQRNWYFADVVSSVIFSLFDRRGTFLDFGGGHGVFTRLMRDKGFDFYWNDPHGQNIFARGFEYREDHRPIALITSIECFEHFTKPKKELATMLGISPNIFFATQLLPSPVPQPEEWEYYGLTHGQHISFYSAKTLHHIARQNGVRVFSNGINMHLFTQKELRRTQFNRSIRPNPWRRFLIGKAMKSKSLLDYREIVGTKNNRTTKAER
jgi:hypothetical protein